jgi:hypothetical protein
MNHCTRNFVAMDERPGLTQIAREPVYPRSFGAWRWLAAAPFVLAAIGGLSWADAPALLVKGLVVTTLTAVVVFLVYLCFRKAMR